MKHYDSTELRLFIEESPPQLAVLCGTEKIALEVPSYDSPEVGLLICSNLLIYDAGVLISKISNVRISELEGSKTTGQKLARKK